MTRFVALCLLPIVAMTGAIGASYLICPGCVARSRVNTSCEWAGDTIFPIDPRNRAYRQHLIADAQLAEELAIRYADAEHKRLFGYEGHGGLIDHGRVRNECMARLVTTIENNHFVTSQQVAIARGQRNRLFDLTVGLSFVPLYCFGATMACLVLRRRFSSDQRHVRLVFTGLTSIAASFIGLQLGQLFAGLWEVRRVGNGHMSSFRAAMRNVWVLQHLGALFVGGIVLFWLIALLCYRVVSDDTHTSTDARIPGGILYR